MLHIAWRSRSRAVGILNLLLTVAFFVLCAYFVIDLLTRDYDSPPRTSNNGSSTNSIKESSRSNSTSDPIKELVMGVFWLSSFVVIIVICLDLFTVILLLKATKKGADPIVALKKACIFRNVNIVLIICISGMCIYFQSLNYILLTEIGLRVIFVGTVWRYIFELSHKDDTGVPPKPSSVVISEQS